MTKTIQHRPDWADTLRKCWLCDAPSTCTHAACEKHCLDNLPARSPLSEADYDRAI